jgi:hypothetical protein
MNKTPSIPPTRFNGETKVGNMVAIDTEINESIAIELRPEIADKAYWAVLG